MDKYEKVSAVIVAAWSFAVILALTFWVGVGAVVIHFIHKSW